MARQTALRLDDETEAMVRYLTELRGTQSEAIKAAIRNDFAREQQLEKMRDFVAWYEAEHGPISDDARSWAADFVG